MYDVILVRFGEMTLKKKNYNTFLKQINNNIKQKLKNFPNLEIKDARHRIYLFLNGHKHEEVIEVLNTIVGLSSYSLCKITSKDFDEISQTAIQLINYAKKKERITFKVETNRSDKSFPYNSLEISQEVAKRILPKIPGLMVNVHHPEMTLFIDFRTEGVFVYLDSIPGLGGFPGGMAGSGLVMMSGGIDSPVSAFLSIKKGVNIQAIHFYSPPHTSILSLQKVIDLCERLCEYMPNGKMNLMVVPFTKIQEKIYQSVDDSYIITIMRRIMYKIAHQVCQKYNIDCIINGESIGQVASQTIESMKVVNEVTNIPILRPLLTYDKTEIIEIARKIKTYDISIRPFDDCCTIFVPKHPVIKPTIKKAIYEEEKCNLQQEIEQAIKNIEIIELSSNNHYSVLEIDTNQDKFEI